MVKENELCLNSVFWYIFIFSGKIGTYSTMNPISYAKYIGIEHVTLVLLVCCRVESPVVRGVSRCPAHPVSDTCR